MSSFFLGIVGEELIKAISWTFFHSLWQGFLLAILAGIAVLVTRKSSPGLRYNILCGLFFAFLMVSGFTFFSQLETATQASKKIQPAQLGSVLMIRQDQHANNISNGFSFYQIFGKCLAYFNEHAYLVVTIWFVVFCVKFIKLLANVSYIQRARNYKTSPAAEYWQERMLELAESLGIRKKILLLQSQWIKVPMVAGWLKPVILFPFSMLSQLPPDQVEAVLLHELAHIRRRDYFVNLFQSLADTIFFFNPGLIWISSLIRDERENCCDDLALSRSRSNKAFVHALLAFEEFDLNAGSYATGFPGRKNHLLRRVKRILNHNNQTLNTMERIFLGGCLLAITLGSVAFAQEGKQHTRKVQSSDNVSPATSAVAISPTTKAQAPSQSIAATETTPSALPEAVILNDSTPPKKKGTGKFIIDEDGVVIYIRDGYRIETKNDKITAAYFNEVKIPDNQLSEKEPMLRKLIREQQTESMKALHADKQLLLDQSVELQALADVQHKELLDLQNALSEADASRTLQKLKLDHEIILDKQEHESMELNLMNKLQLELNNRSLGRLDANNAANQALLQNKINLMNNDLQLQQQKLTLMDQKKLAEITYDNYGNMFMDAVAPVIADLMEDKIIRDTKELSFELNNEKFTVNKVTQSTAIHKKYKQKYLSGPKDHMNYSISKNGIQADINRNK